MGAGWAAVKGRAGAEAWAGRAGTQLCSTRRTARPLAAPQDVPEGGKLVSVKDIVMDHWKQVG